MRLVTILKVIAHLAFWSIVLFALLRMLGVQQMENVEILNGVRKNTVTTINSSFDAYLIWGCSAVMFYINAFYLLPAFLKAGKVRLYIAAIAAIAGVVAVIASVLIKYLRGLFHDSQAFGFPVYAGLIIVMSLLVMSYAYFFIIEWINNEQIKRILREENLRTELNFLRAQVQPHFLFNVLNNLMSMAVETGHKELIGGISSLSALMRYMVYEGSHDRIALTREVGYLENYIQLQSLKFAAGDRVQIQFNKTGDLASVVIAPFVLLPMVENAFKYGINLEAESVISMDLRVDAGSINFVITNTDFSAINVTNKEKSGVGLENVRRRLELIYPRQHRLKVDKLDGHFTVTLSITIPNS